MKQSSPHLQFWKSLFIGLTLLFASSLLTQAQEDVVELNALLGFRIGDSDVTYIDSTHQFTLPNWRRESRGHIIPIQYALHKSGNELLVFLDFKRKIANEALGQINVVKLKNQDSLFLAVQRVDSNTLKVRMRDPEEGFAELRVLLENQILGTLEIDVVTKRRERVFIIPLTDVILDEKLLEKQINAILKPFQLAFDIQLMPSFFVQDLENNPLLDNPSQEFDHYTRQMRTIRDAYFNNFPNSNRQAYYAFVHEGFVNEDILGYTSRGKAISFIKNQSTDELAYHLAVQLARGIGALQIPSTENPNAENLMFALGDNQLNPNQWRKLHLNFRGYPFYDEDEEINTFNGFVAYYFWEENEDGNIIFSPGAFRRALQRPYKKNYFSYHLNIEKRLFKPLFHLFDYPISPLHIFLFVIYVAVAILLRRKWEKRIADMVERKFKIRKVIGRTFLILGVLSLTGITFSSINSILAQYEIYDGVVPDFRNLQAQEVRRQILYSNDIRRSALPEMASEVLIKRGEDWVVKRRKRVLYFDLHQDSSGIYSIGRFNRESDSIIIEYQGIAMLAPSHYFIINRIDENSNYESQMVFNHQGNNVTRLLNFSEEPAKRILLFVNGYRPTSLGNSLEENFRDIRERGVEFPNSKNMIHNFDRYNYWRPWREIDLRFEKRINPSETYYADGHFSVSTSNYRSLIHFTQVSKRYPSRCKDPEYHTCQNQGRTSWFRSSNDATYQLLPNRPNYSGFKLRRENGRIAGLNLVQQLNEIPNSSHNDTLYIVAHSMGYAYALGMIDELRGKINFGGFYILAPENASAGYVNPSEWNEIWQYGVNHEAFKKTAPCLLDGVAPQTLAKGLDAKHNVFIPEHLYRRFGFFDSHFVGFYDWIFDLEVGDPGKIEQR